MSNVSKAVILLSGGMDSTVLLARSLHKGFDVLPMSIFYGQRHMRELKAADDVVAYYNARYPGRVSPIRQVDLSRLAHVFEGSGSSQVEYGVDVPEGAYDEPSMSKTVVPNRNMILLAVAQAYAISQKAHVIGYAAHAGDHAIYMDCRPVFVRAMAEAFIECDGSAAELYTPFILKSKADIVKIGIELDVPFDLTWTCYRGLDAACGKCGTCVERLEAFHLNGTFDPIEYETRDFWQEALKGGNRP